ncbi:MAG: hypothetical protein OEY06_01780 [Gammaproteobacteria bacterium]|nr:hypothetical protein [Gammaproteobacteria bacterium]
MSAATIVFTDIVGFSKKPTADQKRLVEALTSEVADELGALFSLEDKSDIVALPTGDGLALAFLHRTNQLWNHGTILSLILRMHKWANNQSSPGRLVSLRVGVHVGVVERVTDINGKANLCGDTINFTQRVMDAANPRQTLYSDAAFREYVGSELPSCNTHPFSANLKADFLGPMDVYAKHGLQILVYKLSLDPPQSYWSNDDPIAKHLMLVTLTPLPKEVVGSFSERIQKGTSIAFIQLTGDRFISSYNDGQIELSEELKRFWVFMPAPDTYANLNLTNPQATATLVQDCIQKWQDLFASLKTKYTEADFKIGLFKEPPYFGGSFIDWERPGGKIHVSPYIWNVAAPKCPGYDIDWIGTKPSAVYDTYVEGLQFLHQSTKNELLE